MNSNSYAKKLALHIRCIGTSLWPKTTIDSPWTSHRNRLQFCIKWMCPLRKDQQCTELRFVHFLSDFFKAGTGEQDIHNPKKVWKVTCKIARVFAEICRFYQKVSLKWPHFTHKVTPFFSFKNILFPDKNEFLEFLYK